MLFAQPVLAQFLFLLFAPQAVRSADVEVSSAFPPIPSQPESSNSMLRGGRSNEKDLLSEEVKLLQARLALTKQRRDLLQHENAELHGEVQGWVKLGRTVKDREAKLLNTMADSATVQRSSTGNSLGLLSRSNSRASSESSTLSISSLFSHSHPSFMFVFLLGTFVCEIGVLVLWWYISGNRRIQLKPVFRAMGLAGRVVEFSELQVGGLHAPGGELLIQLCSGVPAKKSVQSSSLGDHARAVCTRAIEQLRPGALLRFNEPLFMALRKNDGDCIFGIFRRDEPRETRIAYFRIPSSELLSLLNRAHGEYYRFELVVEAARVTARNGDMERDSEEVQDTRPYIAMRMRDVPSTTKGAKSMDV